jgi:hypothetical protein
MEKCVKCNRAGSDGGARKRRAIKEFLGNGRTVVLNARQSDTRTPLGPRVVRMPEGHAGVRLRTARPNPSWLHRRRRPRKDATDCQAAYVELGWLRVHHRRNAFSHRPSREESSMPYVVEMPIPRAPHVRQRGDNVEIAGEGRTKGLQGARSKQKNPGKRRNPRKPSVLNSPCGWKSQFRARRELWGSKTEV